jgi:predicted SAM-dependent methyltransferase
MIKINMGCGWRDFGKDWIHIDSGDYGHLDYESIVDLSQFKDNTVDLIYASHVIEYFDRQEIPSLLSEWKRILKPDGILRLAVPNFYEISRLYSLKMYPLDNFVGLLYGRMKMGEATIYHKTVYDFESLKKVLESGGFKDVRKYAWRKTEHAKFDDHSQAYLPHMNKTSGVLMSLNVECTK